jgi:hypothetical protein
MMTNKVMVDVGNLEELKEAKEAIGLAMADALMGKQHKDEARREMRTEQLRGLEVAVELINKVIKEEERIQKLIDFPVDIDSY